MLETMNTDFGTKISSRGREFNEFSQLFLGFPKLALQSDQLMALFSVLRRVLRVQGMI